MHFRDVDESYKMSESGDTQLDSRILFVNNAGGQLRIE